MNTILLILTGGTIGSEKKKNIVNVSKRNNLLKSLLSNKISKKIDFKITQPINILSENALPKDWNKIIDNKSYYVIDLIKCCIYLLRLPA